MPNLLARRPRQPVRASPPWGRADFRVFIDFDNTITVGDVLDGVIEAFSPDQRWRRLEEDWAAGRISTRACLNGQVRGLRARWPEIEAHLDRVALDPGFGRLRDLLRRDGVELVVVSDNFDLFVAHILRRHCLGEVPFHANHLRISGDRLIPSFPYANRDCPGCAHCKKQHFLPPNDDGRAVIYVGDGRSDLCPARHADVVFAKATLLECLNREAIACTAFDRLDDVAEVLSRTPYDDKR